MKPTKAPSMECNEGMTLLELMVVILVLLSFIAILFIGARAWREGSDRSANILNIRNVQQAVRSHANLHGLPNGATLYSSDIVGVGKYLDNVKPPNSDIVYAYCSMVPDIGTLYLTAIYSEGSFAIYAPSANTFSGW